MNEQILQGFHGPVWAPLRFSRLASLRAMWSRRSVRAPSLASTPARPRAAFASPAAISCLHTSQNISDQFEDLSMGAQLLLWLDKSMSALYNTLSSCVGATDWLRSLPAPCMWLPFTYMNVTMHWQHATGRYRSFKHCEPQISASDSKIYLFKIGYLLIDPAQGDAWPFGLCC